MRASPSSMIFARPVPSFVDRVWGRSQRRIRRLAFVMEMQMPQDRKSFDFAEHRQAYAGFVRMTVIAVFLLLSHLVALAVGGVAHLWGLACFELVLSIVAAVIGAALPGLNWKPGAVVLALCLLSLAITAA